MNQWSDSVEISFLWNLVCKCASIQVSPNSSSDRVKKKQQGFGIRIFKGLPIPTLSHLPAVPWACSRRHWRKTAGIYATSGVVVNFNVQVLIITPPQPCPINNKKSTLDSSLVCFPLLPHFHFEPYYTSVKDLAHFIPNC